MVTKRSCVLLVAALVIGTLSTAPTRAEGSSKPLFSAPWIAATGPEPEMQVQRYDADTFVIRQSIATNPEGPFLYLLFGTDRALLEDTGAGGLKIAPTVDKVIAQWLAEKGRTAIPLVVAHSHAHGDHIAGDDEFAARPDVTVIGHTPGDVAAFFKIKSWPHDVASFDLGGRVLGIIPTPGHEAAAIMIYDPQTHFLLTGDSLYSGRIYVKREQLQTFRDSIDRAVAFTQAHDVTWLMGTHIEMTTTPRRDYGIGAHHHPDEHVLELPYARLTDLQTSLHQMNDGPELDVHDDFIFYPLP